MEKERKFTPSDVPRLTPEEVRKRIAGGERFMIVDTRDREAFEKSHIEGAMSVPSLEFECLTEMMSKRESWVFYCT